MPHPHQPPRRPPRTYPECHALFHLPVAQAAATLGVSRPTISKVLRAHGVPRWPYRKLKAQHRLDEWRLARHPKTPPSPQPSPSLPAPSPLPTPDQTQPQPIPQHPQQLDFWYCDETLDDPASIPTESPPSPSPFSTHTVSTLSPEPSHLQPVHRATFGNPDWSRGMFSPDPCTGALEFRFHGPSENQVVQIAFSPQGDGFCGAQEQPCLVPSSLSISEEELFRAVGDAEEVCLYDETDCAQEVGEEAVQFALG